MSTAWHPHPLWTGKKARVESWISKQIRGKIYTVYYLFLAWEADTHYIFTYISICSFTCLLVFWDGSALSRYKPLEVGVSPQSIWLSLTLFVLAINVISSNIPWSVSARPVALDEATFCCRPQKRIPCIYKGWDMLVCTYWYVIYEALIAASHSYLTTHA